MPWTLILSLKREHPSWGAPKIREKLRRRHPDLKPPAISTVHAVLDRHDLVAHGRERRYKAQGTSLSTPTSPNDLWCADFKGEFMLADKRYCYPLTITDFATRYLICCDALASTHAKPAFAVFETASTRSGRIRDLACTIRPSFIRAQRGHITVSILSSTRFTIAPSP